MKIAILYICTGNYSVFWPDFYRSFEQHFFPSVPKHYFVFTDNTSLSNDNNVTIVPKKCSGFPADSLFRYDLFIEIEKDVKEYDYTFFMNSNMLCIKDVGEEILPTEKNSFLVFTESYGYLGRNPRIYPYERNPKSNAYIPHVKSFPYRYVLGGVNGGRTSEYFSFIHFMSEKIRDDDIRGIMAIYHDESHVNRYFFDHPNCKVLSYEYALAEGANAPLAPIIVIRDKTKVSSYFNKKRSRGLLNHLLFQFKRLIHFVIW